MIKAIIFDCYGVLYLSKYKHYYQQLVARHPQHRPELEDLERQVNYGLLDDQDYHEAVARLTGATMQDITSYIVNGFVRNQDLLDYIAKELRPQYKIGMLSNLGRSSLEQFFSPAERATWFDQVAISSEIGMVKPHPEAFEYICHQLGVDVSEAIMVDDLAENCAGARQAGLQAIEYIDLTQVQQELERLL